MASKIFEDKTPPPTPEESSIHVVMTREDVDFMSAAVAGLPGQRKMSGVDVQHAARPRKGHAY
jgi:hypothetical protein